MNLSRSDMGTWLINLDRDKARLDAMKTQLDTLGLAFNRFPAVYGKDNQEELLKAADEAAYQRNMGSNLLPGKLGVFASHTRAWKDFLKSDHKVALILEDDVVFHDDFLESLDAALSIADHWDTIRFNCIRAKLPICQGKVGRYSMNAYLGPFTGNAAYLIHRATAEKLQNSIWPQTRALDHELNRFFIHNFRQMGLEPFSSHPDDGNVSTITGTNFAAVKKPHWTKRLPYYRLKAGNYFRRAWWLLKSGMLFPKSGVLK